MLVINLHFLFVYILQMISTKESSYVVVETAPSFTFTGAFYFVGFEISRFIILCRDLIGGVVSLFYTMYLCRIWPCDLSISLNLIYRGNGLQYCCRYQSDAIKCSQYAHYRTVRMGIQVAWDIATFGKYPWPEHFNLLMHWQHLALSVWSSFRFETDGRSKLPKIFNQLRNVLMVLMFGVLLLYYPWK